MTDLAELGLKVDSSSIDAASKSLGTFSQSGKSAQVSADVLVAASVRLGISVQEVERRLAAANDNLSANAEQAMKLADATKLATAANDNFAKSMSVAGQETDRAGKGFFGTIEHVLNLTSHLKLLAVAAYALSPAFRGFVNSGISKILLEIVPASGLAAKAISGIATVLGPLLSTFARLGAPILVAVTAFQILHAIWDKGSALLDKYANSLRALYSDDIVQNLERLTRGQTDIISAEQVARATELGVRLQDASFTINKFLTTGVIDLTNVSLKLQTVWVNIVEIIAKAVQYVNMIPWDKVAKVAALATAPALVIANTVSNINSSEDNKNSASIQAATARLSAMMGVANLASESLGKTTKAVGDLDKELDIGGSFIARFSDAIKKLSDPKDSDTWDRTTNAIKRNMAALIANSESVGQTVEFQEKLRVETKLLESTRGGLNAATDEQIAKYAELRSSMEVEQALQASGIKLDKDRTESMKELAAAMGEARMQLEQQRFAIQNDKALKSDEISTQALGAFSPAQKGEIAALQKRLELQDLVTKGIATQAQVEERASSARELAIATEVKQLTEAARARALAADQTAATAKVAIDAIGKSVGETYRLTTIEQTRQQLEQDASARHASIDQNELARLTEKINKTAELKQQEAEKNAQDKANFELQTAFMSQLDQQIAATQKQLHGPAWKDYMNDGLAATMRLADSFKTLKDAAETFASGFAKDLINGVPAIEALRNALKTLASSLIDSAIKKLVDQAISSVAGAITGAAAGTGQAATMTAGATSASTILTTAGTTVAASIVAGATQAATILGLTIPESAATLPVAGAVTGTEVAEGGVAAGAALATGGAAAGSAIWGPIAILVAAIAAIGAMSFFGGKKDDSLQQAKDNWAKMTDQVRDFNEAARGVNLDPITQAIRSLISQYNQLGEAAAKAKDWGALAQLQNTLNQGVLRLVLQYRDGNPVLGEFAQKIKDANDAAATMRETMVQLGFSAADVAGVISSGLTKALDSIRMQAESMLRSEINTNSGVGWLNDINAAVAKFNDLAGTVDPNLLDTWFRSALQKIVDDAQLQGQAFQQLVNGMPQIAAYIHEYTAAVDESGKAAAAAAAAHEKANLQLRLLTATTDQNTLAGALAVNSLRQQIEMNDAIANNSQNIALLQQVQAAETFNIVQSFANKSVEAAKTAADEQARVMQQAQDSFNGFVKNIRDFISHYLAGPSSGLSPSAQLANAQANFASQLSLAQGGNRDALNSITQYFTDLINASKAQFGSSASGQAINSAALAQLQALPGQISPEQFIVNAINSASADQVSATVSLHDFLTAALNTGNNAVFAGAMLAKLTAIDTNSDNSISFDEMKAALGTTYDTGTLQKVFNALDADNSKLISKTELIKAATGGTKTNTDPIVDVKTNTASLPDQATKIAGMETSLLALAEISSHTGTSNALLQDRVNQNLREISHTLAPGVTLYGSGTNFHPGGLAIVGDRGPELLNLPRGSQVIPNHVAFNPAAANNNDAVVAAIYKLIERLDRLEERTVAAERGVAEYLGEKLDKVVENTQSRAKENRRAA